MKKSLALVLLFLCSVSLFGAVLYEKVTSKPEGGDWSGKYLIVCEEESVAFDGSLEELYHVDKSNCRPVKIRENRIIVAEDDFYFTIENDDNSLCRIKSVSGFYIYHEGNSANLSGSSDPKRNSLKFDESTSSVDIKSPSVDDKYYLRYNSGEDKNSFCYYSLTLSDSDTKSIQLYRAVENVDLPKYNVTFYNGDTQYGDVVCDFGVQLPEEDPVSCESCREAGWKFVGWSETKITTDVEEVTLVDNPYIPTQDCSLYAVYKQVVDFEEQIYTFTPTSSTSATSEPELPEGATVEFENTYSVATTMTKEKSQTWTIIGLDIPLVAVSASMKTNKSSGSGNIKITVGDEEVYYLSSYYDEFGYSEVYSDKQFPLTSNDKVGDIVITIKATINSLHCQSLTIKLRSEEVVYNSNPQCDYIVEVDEKCAVDKKVKINSMTIKSNGDETGELKVASGVLFANKVVVEKQIDDQRWYFFSLPFDCKLADMVAIDAEGKVLEYAQDATSGDYVINEYDQVRSTTTSKAWKELLGTEHTLNAGQGYIIGYFGTGKMTVKFPSTEKQEITKPVNATLDYTNNWFVDGENSVKGFNLVGLPYYESVGGGMQPDFVTKPNADGKTYTQVEYVDADIAPFESFFVQTKEAPVFTVTQEQLAAPVMRVGDERSKVVISFADASGGCDKTTIIDNPNSSSDYEIGRDLVKWIGYAYLPQIYTIQGEDMLAFNSLAVDNSTVIPLGVYAHCDDEYTFTFDEKSIGDLQDWVLYDKATGVTSHLSDVDYSLYLAKGEYEGRFELRKSQIVTTECDNDQNEMVVWATNCLLNINNLPIDAIVCIYDAVGRLVYMARPDAGEFDCDFDVQGVYLVVVSSGAGSFTAKIIY